MKYVSYCRVSTDRQGIDGYGMAAQMEAVSRYLKSDPSAELIATFEEIESGANNERTQLAAALKLAKARGATLIIAKLDRLSRNAAFLLQLQDSCVSFLCCDMPTADRFTIGILALVAQRERELISQRTKAGLAVAKARGVVLGNPNAPQAWGKALARIQERKHHFAASAMASIQEIQSTGITSLSRISDCLNKRGERTPRGGHWTTTAVKRTLATAKQNALFAKNSVQV
jgi:DNA invertase Pin-like site-specific DNA recombinase